MPFTGIFAIIAVDIIVISKPQQKSWTCLGLCHAQDGNPTWVASTPLNLQRLRIAQQVMMCMTLRQAPADHCQVKMCKSTQQAPLRDARIGRLRSDLVILTCSTCMADSARAKAAAVALATAMAMDSELAVDIPIPAAASIAHHDCGSYRRTGNGIIRVRSTDSEANVLLALPACSGLVTPTGFSRRLGAATAKACWRRHRQARTHAGP